MEAFWAALIAGIGAGGVYALLGCGIVVAFRGSGVINFGHGAIAGYAAFNFDELREPGRGNIYLPWVDPIPEWSVFQKLGISNLPVRIHIMENPPTWLAVLMVLLVSALIGLMMHFLVFRPLRNAPTLAKVIGSLGVFIYLGAVGLRNFGNSTRNDPGWWKFDSTSDAKTVWFTDKTMPGSNFWLMVTALVVGGLLWLFFRYSRFGIATRAADENEKGAALLGYSPQLLAGLNWVLSSVLAGIAGIVFFTRRNPASSHCLWSLLSPRRSSAISRRFWARPSAVSGLAWSPVAASTSSNGTSLVKPQSCGCLLMAFASSFH